MTSSEPQPPKGASATSLETVGCDLCGADPSSAAVLWRGRAWPAPVPDDIALVECRRCGLVYLSPRPTPAGIGAFYPPDYAPFRPAIEDEPSALMRWMRRRKIRKRRQLVEAYAGRKRGRVLDVGCSTGLFLHEMELAGWRTQGVELTHSAAAYARERFGLEVFEGMLEEAPYEAGSFEVITFWDVLEHVFSPRDTLARSHALLAPGGTIAINIPNWRAAERGLFGRYWAGYDPPRHLYVFPHAALERYLREAGFEVQGWTCFMPSYFTIIISIENGLAARAPRWTAPVMRLLRFPGLRFLLQAPFWLMDRLGRGSVISVFARKPG